MYLKQTLIIAFAFSAIGLGAWELYWRSQGFYPTIDDNESLWSVQRSRVEKANEQDVVLIGSSRVLFDIQLDEWENETGKRPIQLACVGSSPLPVFHDIVEKTNFNGTILVGVTPGLFFLQLIQKEILGNGLNQELIIIMKGLMRSGQTISYQFLFKKILHF